MGGGGGGNVTGQTILCDIYGFLFIYLVDPQYIDIQVTSHKLLKANLVYFNDIKIVCGFKPSQWNQGKTEDASDGHDYDDKDNDGYGGDGWWW